MGFVLSLVGAFVGLITGVLIREIITGGEYGANQWQRAGDKQFVSDSSGFIRWVVYYLGTAAAGWYGGPIVHGKVLLYLRSASQLEVFGVGFLVSIVLFKLFEGEVLGRR